MKQLFTTSDFEEAVQLSFEQPILIFKHSQSCFTSHRAIRQVQEFIESSIIPSFLVVVQRSRNLSNQIAQNFSIQHESPQLIVLENGEPTFHTSHGNITTTLLKEILA